MIALSPQCDAISVLEKEHDYRDEHFDFIQSHIRKFCLQCILQQSALLSKKQLWWTYRNSVSIIPPFLECQVTHMWHSEVEYWNRRFVLFSLCSVWRWNVDKWEKTDLVRASSEGILSQIFIWEKGSEVHRAFLGHTRHLGRGRAWNHRLNGAGWLFSGVLLCVFFWDRLCSLA